MASACPPKYQDTDVRQHVCDENGTLIQRTRLTSQVDPTQMLPLMRETFASGRLAKKEFWAFKKDIQRISTYSYSDGKIFVERKVINNAGWQTDLRTVYRDQGSELSLGDDDKLQTWGYVGTEGKTVENVKGLAQQLPSGVKFEASRIKGKSRLLYIEDYELGGFVPTKKKFFGKNGQLIETHEFVFDKTSAAENGIKNIRPISYRITKADKTVSLDYRDYEKHLSIQEIYQDKKDISFAEIKRRENIFNDKNKIAVAMLDGGVDLSHPMYAYKLFPSDYGLNPYEKHGLPLQAIYPVRGNAWPAAHGTHVASILLKDHEDVGLYSFAQPRHEESTDGFSSFVDDMIQFLNAKKVRFMNSSVDRRLSFHRDPNRMHESARRYKATKQSLDKLISQTPETLHTLVAGNSKVGVDIDNEEGFKIVPAQFKYDNMIVVAALDTDKLEAADMHRYRFAVFSNYGEKSVDIAAPGRNILGARLGYGKTRLSGTSQAAPFLMNQGILAVHKANPSLSNAQIKEVIMKTAYIYDLDAPMPIKSGGMLFPRRAIAAAKVLKANKNLSIEEACILARKNDKAIFGEVWSEAYFSKLKAFWKSRGLTKTPEASLARL